MKKQITKQLPLYHRIWSEGRYVDFWNIPHFLVGLLIGFVLIYLKSPFALSLFIVFLIKSGWEIYEHIRVIKEAIPNKILDVVTGILGYLFIYWINQSRPLTQIDLGLVVLLEIFFASWGLYSAKKLGLYIKHGK